MKAKFTAGPWEQDKYLNVVDGKGERVLFRGVSTLMSGEGISEAEANTTLIAAAPELLAALKTAAEVIGHPDDSFSVYMAKLIAKATGN